MATPTIYLLFSKIGVVNVTSSFSISCGVNGLSTIDDSVKSEASKQESGPLDGFALMASSTSLEVIMSHVKSNPFTTHKVIPINTILDVKLDFSVSLGGIAPGAVEKEFGE